MNDRGVSPVVGTIILIAITVIVAGTIAYYATG
ncbi:MAG: archaellin/type IV pilin N-terminal domain-containing protein, partial [Candidatus Hadarchaeota archaeon]